MNFDPFSQKTGGARAPLALPVPTGLKGVARSLRKKRIYFVLVIFIVIYHKCFDVLRIDISLL